MRDLHNARMTPHRRACLFCGTVRKTTNEHIIAAWIGRLLRDHYGAIGEVSFRHESEHPEAGVPTREKHAKQPRYISRAFCANCNGGWMGRLEERAEPVVGPLILGEARSLSAADQETLVFWATKTSLAFLSVEHETTKWARAEEYRALFCTQAPLPNSQVWVGASGQGLAIWYRPHRHPHPLLVGETGEVHGFGVTLAVGYAVFYVLVGYSGRVDMRLRDEPATMLREIWPTKPRGVQWPPDVVFPARHYPIGVPASLAEYRSSVALPWGEPASR
jgi:hypothetical protein